MGTWSFSVSIDAGPSFPTYPPFITQTPTTTIDIATVDPLQAGVHDFRITATDSLTLVANTDVVFQVQMLAITSIDLDAATAIPD